MIKILLAPIAGLAMAINAGLGFSQGTEVESDTFAVSPAVTLSSARNAEPAVRAGGAGLSGDGSSVSVLASKLGEREQTVADALMAVRERERSAATLANAPVAANAASGRAARQAAVAGALAAELGIQTETVAASLTELQAARRSVGTTTRL